MSVYRIRSSNMSLAQFVNSLQLRTRSPDEAERQKFEHSQVASVQKILTTAEIQPKEKHVRNIILGSFHEEGAYLFWTLMTDIQLESHPVICWKFCYLLHRLLRDGHHNVLKDSISVSSYIQQLGKFWSALPQQYGAMIQSYCNLLSCKLSYHQKFPFFPGNLQLPFKDLRSLIADSQDAYFEICADSLDYLDCLLDFGNVVLKSIDQLFASSMTVVGQSRLLPLVSCIHEANTLYDLIVKTLFEMHSALHASDLEGHRTRFFTSFKRLQEFFKKTKNMQFFTGLIQIPSLPKTPPNFELRESLNNYQTPVCVLSEASAETKALPRAPSSSVSSLAQDPVNLLEQYSPMTSSDRSLCYPALPSMDSAAYSEVEELRNQLQNANNTIRMYDKKILELREEFDRMRNELKSKQEIIDALNSQLASVDFTRDNAAEEKYEKMKSLYTKLREQHVTALRKESEMKKQLSQLNEALKKSNARDENYYLNAPNKKTADLDEELKQWNDSKDNSLSKLAELEKEIETLRIAKTNLTESCEELENTLKELKSRESDYLKNITELSLECDNRNENLREQIKLKEDLSSQLAECKAEIDNLKTENKALSISCESHSQNAAKFENQETELSNMVERLKKDLEEAFVERDECKNELIKAKESLIAEIADKDKEIDEIKETIETLTKNFAELQTKMKKIEIEKDKLGSLLTVNRGQVHTMTGNKLELEENLMDLLHEKEDVDEKLSLATAKCLEQQNCIEALTADIIRAENNLEEKITKMRFNIIDHTVTCCEYNLRNALSCYDEYAQSGHELLVNRLQCCVASLEKLKTCFTEETGVEIIVSAVYAFSAAVSDVVLYSRSKLISSSDLGKDISVFCNNICLKSLELLLFVRYNHMEKFCTCEEEISALLNKILEKMMNFAAADTNDTCDYHDLIVTEMKNVDASISDANNKIALLLKRSREENNDAEFTVNEKILDSCSKLMEAVCQLIALSKAVQNETALLNGYDEKDYYSKNSTWTEGLVSAVKTVGSNVQHMVKVAESLMNGEGNYEELAVCAQEIAAGTARLVVSSNAKANKNSQNRIALIESSKNVAKLIGTLIALTRSGTELLDEVFIDFSNLSPHELRRLETEAQARVLHLQNQLDHESQKLANLRKQFYELENEDKTAENDSSFEIVDDVK